MTGTAWPVDAVAGSPLYSGRKIRQTQMAPLVAGATAARPLGGRSGVRPGTPANTVTATGTTWTVKPFAGVLDVQAAAEASVYGFAFAGNETGTVTAASASAPRQDKVYVVLDDPGEADGSSQPGVRIEYRAGTSNSGGTLVVTAPPARSMEIAQINVPIAGGGTPTVNWTAPYAVAAGGIVPVRSVAELTALGAWASTENPVYADQGGTLWRNVGSGWSASGGNMGMRIIRPGSVAGSGVTLNGGEVSASGATTISVNNCFTSEFDNYLILVDLASSSAENDVSLYMRSGGTDVGSSVYMNAYMQLASTTPQFLYYAGANSGVIVARVNGTGGGSARIEVSGPALPQYTKVSAEGSDAVYARQHWGTVQTAAAYDGFTLFAGGVGVTGKVRIYGYANS